MNESIIKGASESRYPLKMSADECLYRLHLLTIETMESSIEGRSEDYQALTKEQEASHQKLRAEQADLRKKQKQAETAETVMRTVKCAGLALALVSAFFTGGATGIVVGVAATYAASREASRAFNLDNRISELVLPSESKVARKRLSRALQVADGVSTIAMTLLSGAAIYHQVGSLTQFAANSFNLGGFANTFKFVMTASGTATQAAHSVTQARAEFAEAGVMICSASHAMIKEKSTQVFHEISTIESMLSANQQSVNDAFEQDAQAKRKILDA